MTPMFISNTGSDAENSILSFEKLNESLRRLREQVRNIPSAIHIVESVYATRDAGRVRPYPKRKAKSQAHWRRMDKKWRKRYGFHRVPCAYWVDVPEWSLGRRKRYLVVHPDIAQKIRASIASQSRST